jgi:ATP-dependent DNA helicase PIF1
MNLSAEQQQALDAFNVGFPINNILLTGPGGSGKTALIKRMVEDGEAAGKNVQVCALTGCAAVLLGCKGAKTVHSWAGVGLASGPHGKVVDKVIKSKHKSSGWNKVDVLIIDEISMMSKKLFNILDSIGRKVRKGPDVPFGGIQVVFSGDFYQLPPVGDRDDEETSAFCFESDQWKSTFHKTVQLTTIFRQTDDKYTKILNQIRVGKLRKSSYETLMAHVGKKVPADSIIKPTILFPKRRNVDLINRAEMAELKGEPRTFVLSPDTVLTAAERESVASVSDVQREKELAFLTNNIIAEETLTLKKGAQVMCIANIDMEGPYPIVNGSQGVIVDFINNALNAAAAAVTAAEAALETTIENAPAKIEASESALREANKALSVAKMELEERDKDDKDYDDAVKAVETLKAAASDAEHANKRAKNGIKRAHEALKAAKDLHTRLIKKNEEKLPLVQFNDGQKRIIGRHVWRSENVPGLGVKQIPLILAWAITIHKAQGVTLEMAQIDAGSNIFECGQTYVALSRVKDLEGLYLTAFSPQKIKVSRKVQKYYESLVVKLLKSEGK